jgi:hypothetical protein
VLTDGRALNQWHRPADPISFVQLDRHQQRAWLPAGLHGTCRQSPHDWAGQATASFGIVSDCALGE